MADDVSALLAAAGVSEAEIEAARRDGVLVALLADVFLLGRRVHTLDAVASASGMDTAEAQRLFRALGFPPPSDELVASDEDVAVLQLLQPAGGEIDAELLQEARAISAALRRVADVLVDEIWRHYRAAEASDADAAQALAGRVNLARTERLLLHLLRRQLVASMYRRSALATSGSALAVGFVDLVGFTALAQQLETEDLGRLVERFESTTSDIVTDVSGQLVKTLGDGVLFTCADASTAAAAALDMLDAVAASIAPARAAVGFGPVLVREGDVFGPVVNLTSRLVELAEPGRALAPAELGLPGDDAGVRQVRGIGEVAVVTLRRS